MSNDESTQMSSREEAWANLYGRLRDRLDDLGQVMTDWHGVLTREQFIEVFTENGDADLLPETLVGGDA